MYGIMVFPGPSSTDLVQDVRARFPNSGKFGSKQSFFDGSENNNYYYIYMYVYYAYCCTSFFE